MLHHRRSRRRTLASQNKRRESKEKTAFMMPCGKKHFCSVPMGVMNAHACFVAMVSKMEIKWNALYDARTKKTKEVQWKWLKDRMEEATAIITNERNEKEKHKQTKDTKQLPRMKEADFEPFQKPNKRDPKPGSAVIVDDIILFAHSATAMLFYFICMIEIFQHYQATIKLRKTRLFPAPAEFVGADVTKDGNSPAKSKHEALKGIEKPSYMQAQAC
jgi:hypothetical protein